MAAPTAQLTFLERALKSRLVTEEQVNRLFPDRTDRANPQLVADGLLKAGLLTRYHVQMLQAGKYRGFFLGPYKILRPIGQGGMGTVFLAEHTSLARKVAVKVLPPDKAKDRLSLERFNREARAAAALDHPNIVRLHDISQGNGVHFLVMEYVEGNDLQSLMGQTGPLHYAQAAQYVAQAAAGLHHAHEKGFIHRDIKPANLMLTKPGGGIKILDMGLARSFTDAADNLTANLAEGDIAGTVDYLSPEQAMNQPLDERSDIYSLGATFYALVAGYPPFKGTTAQKLMQHQLKEPPSVALKLSGRVPQALSDVVSKMMAKRPSERFQSAADVIDALGPWLPVPTSGNIVIDTPRPGGSGQTLPIGRTGSGSRQAPPAAEPSPRSKRPAVLIAATVALLAVVGGAIAAVAFALGNTTADLRNSVPTSLTGGTPPTQTQPTQPAAPAGFQVPYTKIDFAGLRPGVEKAGGTGKGQRLSVIDGQKLPAGVIVNHFSSDALGEYSLAEVNGATAMGMRLLNKKVGVQIHYFTDGTLTRLPDGAKVTLRLTYLHDGTGEGQAFYELCAEPYTKSGHTKLPPTGGKWKSVDIPFTRPAGTKGYELVVNSGYTQSVEGTLYIRTVELLPADGAAQGLTPDQPKPADPPAVPAVPLAADFSGFGIGTYALDKSVVAPADGWAANQFDADATGELVTANEDGAKVVTLVNKSGTPSVQLYQTKPGGTLVTGGAYLLKLEYKATAGTSGKLDVREKEVGNWKDCPYSFKLEPTGGKWEARTFEVEAAQDYPAVIVLQNVSDASGNSLSVRKVELVPVGGKPTAAPSAAADDRLAYSLDLTGQKAFAVRRKARDTVDLSRTGDGTPPVGWRTHSWEATCEHELFADTRDGSPVLGLRFVSGKAAGMMAVDGIRVKPNSTYELTFEYQTPGEYTGDNGVRYRSTGNGGKLVLGGKLDKTDGKWVEKVVQIKTDASGGLQLEFHHNGPGGEANPFLLRKCQLVAVP